MFIFYCDLHYATLSLSPSPSAQQGQPGFSSLEIQLHIESSAIRPSVWGPPIGLTLDTRSDGLLSTTRWVFVIIPTRSLFWLSGLKYLFQLYFVSEALTIAPVICGLNSSREMKIAFYFPLLYNL